MRSARYTVKGASAVYHVMSRTVNGEALLGDREKEMLRKMLWRVADFSGVEVLTYCLMQNHFHILVRVPEPAAVSDRELVRRFSVLYPEPTDFQTCSPEMLERILGSGGEEAERWRQRLLSRMADLGQFVKTLKQRYSVWFNKTHNRFGTLWAERFKSVLVEGRGNALETVAAYIDLNPVRAGLVSDPKDYRFCGYAEAVAGGSGAVRGLRSIHADQANAGEALSAHRMLLFGKGSAPFRASDGCVDAATADRVLNRERDRLPQTTVLRCRVRYFSDGAVLGSAEFVREHLATWQQRRGRKYPPKAHPLEGSDWGDLAVIQGLRRDVFGTESLAPSE